ncbi:MAG: zf-HC2 domain-containing protein [Candidatus Omnitrophica bacterium]|nr:zf-HC2 domain-containing protein [Candidatus Omnitrophota bacterium]
MKKCDQFKSQILTDYMDKELNKISIEEIESHLLDCGDCRVFFKEVKNRTVLPFQQAMRQPVPEELWDLVKQNIEHSNHATVHLENFIGKLKGLITFPRMIPAFASLILMLLAGSVALNTIQTQRYQEKDQGEFLVALLSSTGSQAFSDSSDLKTPIEHYFL